MVKRIMTCLVLEMIVMEQEEVCQCVCCLCAHTHSKDGSIYCLLSSHYFYEVLIVSKTEDHKTREAPVRTFLKGG